MSNITIVCIMCCMCICLMCDSVCVRACVYVCVCVCVCQKVCVNLHDICDLVPDERSLQSGRSEQSREGGK